MVSEPTADQAATPSKTVSHLPIKKGKHAPQTFKGRFDKINEFFDELEGICNERGVTNPKELCKAVTRYCSRNVVEVIEGLEQYRAGNYEGLKTEIKFIFDSEREEVRYTTADLYQLIRKWKIRAIKDLPTFKKYYREYQRIAGWLHIREKINDDDFKLWFWAGLHKTFRRNVEARMRLEDRDLDDSKAFGVTAIVEAAQKVFTRKRFENRIKLMMERSAEDSDESDEEDDSDVDEDDQEREGDSDDEDNLIEKIAARARKDRKAKTEKAREEEKGVKSRKSGATDVPIDELVAQMKGLNLGDEDEYRVLFNRMMKTDKRWASILRNPQDRGPVTDRPNRGPPPFNVRDNRVFSQGIVTRMDPRKCFGCGKEDHTMNRCEELQKQIDQGTIAKNSYGKWVWKDGSAIERRRGETWLEAINFGRKHVGIARAILRGEEEEDEEEDGEMVMHVEAYQDTDDDDDDDAQQDLGWRRRRDGVKTNYEAFQAIRTNRVSQEARREANNRTNSHSTAKRADNGGVTNKGERPNRKPFGVAVPANETRGHGRVRTLPAGDKFVSPGDEKRDVAPFSSGSNVANKKLSNGVPNLSNAEDVNVVGERLEGRTPKKEEVSEISNLILEKNVTLPVGALLRLIPQLPRTLVQGTKGRRLEVPPEETSLRTDQNPIKDVIMGEREQKVLLQPLIERRGLGRPRGTLIKVLARVGQARMNAVVDSGAMIDVISERMFIASGLARNEDNSMQIGDVNGGAEECLGVIRNATIYLTEGELPTVTDLWVHKNTNAYDLLLGRKWATVNWAGTSEEPEGTYLKFTSEGKDYKVNALPNPRFMRRDHDGNEIEEEEGNWSPTIPRRRKVYMVNAKEEEKNKERYEKQRDSPPSIETYRRRQESRIEEEAERENRPREKKTLYEQEFERRDEESSGTTYPRDEEQSSNKGYDEEQLEWNGARWEESSEEEESTEGSEESSDDSSDLYEWTSEDLIRAILDGVEPTKIRQDQGHLKKNKLEDKTSKDPLDSAAPSSAFRKQRIGHEAPPYGHESSPEDEDSTENESDEEWEGTTKKVDLLPSKPQSFRRTKRTRNESWGSRNKQWDQEYSRASNLGRSSAVASNGSRPKGSEIFLSIVKKGPELTRKGTAKETHEKHTLSRDRATDKDPLTNKVRQKHRARADHREAR
jgi:hypothetical protein